jgi:DNA-binding NtrC family response regulator
MVETLENRKNPLGLVITGEANFWQPVLEQLVGRELLTTYRVNGSRQLLEVVEAGLAHAAVLDEEADQDLDALQMLRLIRRLDQLFPVVIVTRRTDRRLMEDALRLAAFSVLAKPVELEALLRQIQRIMVRLDFLIRNSER